MKDLRDVPIAVGDERVNVEVRTRRSNSGFIVGAGEVTTAERGHLAPCRPVRIFQPIRQWRVATFRSTLLDASDDGVHLPIRNIALAVDCNQMRHDRVRRLPNVTLMMKLVPELVPYLVGLVAQTGQ